MKSAEKSSDFFGTIRYNSQKNVRNPNVVDAFRRIGLSGKGGTGIGAIFENRRTLGFVPPEIDNNEVERIFRLWLYKEKIVDKPDGKSKDRYKKRKTAVDSAWSFVRTHLDRLSVVKPRNGELEFIMERDPRHILDRMVAWFVRHDAPVPLSNDEFLLGLRNRFAERDGMVFLTEQVAEYDRKRAQVARAPRIELIVSDERSAIDWLAGFLRIRPSTYQEVHPEFIARLGAQWRKYETKPELQRLLEDNFIRYDAVSDVPNQIHAYLLTNHKDLRGLDKNDPRLVAKAKDRWYAPDPDKERDLEKKREKALLNEFREYQMFTGRRIEDFRLEVLRAGFKDAWNKKDCSTIISVAEKFPNEALQENEKLFFWYDRALTRMEVDA